MASRISRRFEFTEVFGGEEPYENLIHGRSMMRTLLMMRSLTPNMSNSLFHIQMESLDSLDLSTKNSVGGYWDRRIFNHIQRNLPPLTREHWLEVRRLDKGSMFHQIYDENFNKTAEKEYGIKMRSRLDGIIEPYSRWVDRQNINLDRKEERLRARVIRNVDFARRFGITVDDVFERILPDIVYVNDGDLTMYAIENLFYMNYTRDKFFPYIKDVTTLTTLVKHARERGFDFWGLMRGTGYWAKRYSPVVECLDQFDARHEVATALLSYGFKYTAHKEVYKKQRNKFIKGGYGWNRMIVPESYYTRMQEMLSIDIFYAFLRRAREFDKVGTLARVFRSIPQPYPTPFDFKDILKSIRRPDWDEVINTGAMHYAIHDIHNARYDTTPRDLKNLCRCEIRKALRKNMMLPDGIQEIQQVAGSSDLCKYLNLDIGM